MVLLLSAAVIPPLVLLLSVAGAVVLNAVLAVNHRPVGTWACDDRADETVARVV